MKKIVINQDFGGFSLSEKAMQRYCEIACIEYETVPTKWGDMSLFYKAGHAEDDDFIIDEYKFERDDKILVHVVETLKEEANGIHANLKVVEIPDDVKWVINEYDGLESVHEKHRVWD
jgi:hypothetical protein